MSVAPKMFCEVLCMYSRADTKNKNTFLNIKAENELELKFHVLDDQVNL